jgi:hypothetical protein
VEDDVFEEADFDAEGDDLAELCDEAELLAAGAAVGEGEVGAERVGSTPAARLAA